MPAKPHADSPAVTDGFADAWSQFFRALRRARGRMAQAADPGGLTLPQLQLLAALADEGEMTVGEVALHGGVATPTATRMLTTLERDGIVERHRSQDDARCVSVRLTSAGKRGVRQARTKLRTRQQKVFAALSESERRQAEPLLRRMAEVLEEL